VSYFIADGSNRRGPYRIEELPAQGLRPETMVWREGMADWQRADVVPELRGMFAPPAGAYGQPPGVAQGYAPVGYAQGGAGVVPPFNKSEVSNKKLAAGICGILLHSFGIHKFILGMNGAGLTMLLVTVLSCGIAGPVMAVIGIIEGIIYLTKSDEEFYQTYIVGKKAWF
jgi:TM2 domain-containing membrane protein YozV